MGVLVWSERYVCSHVIETRSLKQISTSTSHFFSISSSKMKRISPLPTVDSSYQLWRYSRTRTSPLSPRCLHTSPAKPATVAPITASGPPPSAPTASAEHVDARVARRRKQAELLKRGRDLRSIAAGSGGGTAKLKRFWNDVHVKHTDGMRLSFSSMHSI